LKRAAKVLDPLKKHWIDRCLFRRSKRFCGEIPYPGSLSLAIGG
jgi:hypothetical protein